ncbi:PTS sugar transporter subunit IIA [Prauserella muralis]|uniref:PTS fructose transporter subunit IIA n=1 Tax=Prauserella muralis TaxID=588067 RepID=A0A2V4B002_9PSEU|nr:fructose PTS transporter subunit IIA [Prauserella muralis]PXY27337.1 PTS fructose transporter subunit IIA [Prauserella muralis]TWE22981.1 PTS system D-fructose-specific IIA component (F1P-forming) (Frc family) [Prauserella muralis]
MAELITADLVELDLAGTDRDEVTRDLTRRLADAGRVTDTEGFLADLRAREAQMPTGIEGGIGIPHARSAHVTEPTLGFGRSKSGVDFGATDGPAHLIFLIAAPEGGGDAHLTILASLARRLMHQSFRQSLHEAPDADAVVRIVREEVLGQ